MSDEFDSLLEALDNLLSLLRRHPKATISSRNFKRDLEDTLQRWAAVKPLLSSPNEIDEIVQSAMHTAESTRPSVRVLRSEFEKIRRSVRQSKLTFLSTNVPHRYTELSRQCAGIWNQVYRGFIEEALRCWTNRTRRAAVVVAWCAVEAKLFDIYKNRWSVDEIKRLIPDANRHYIRIHDDLTYLSDDVLLTGLRDMSVLQSAEYRLLTKVCKTYRDLAAHASLKRDILDDEVSASLGIMLEFLSKPGS